MSGDTELKNKADEKPEDRTSGRKRRVKLPIRAYLVYLLVVVSLTTGVTLSKYVAGTSASGSARIIKIGGIEVVEQTGNSLMKQTDDGSRVFYLVPGVDIEKKAYVNYGGSESASYVFVKIDATGWTQDSSDEYKFTAANGHISWKVDAENWTYLDASSDATYVYYKVVAPNEKLNGADIVADEGLITVSPELTNTELGGLAEGFGLSFEATAVQYDGWAADTSSDSDANVKKAWNSVKSK